LKLVNQQVQRALKEQQKIQKAAENERKRILGAQKKQRIIDNKNETKIKNSSCACAIVTCMAVRVASNANNIYARYKSYDSNDGFVLCSNMGCRLVFCGQCAHLMETNAKICTYNDSDDSETD